MNPTTEQIAKLPKWAQDYIKTVCRERDMAIRTLNEFQDTQTKSDFWIEDLVCTGETVGPATKVRYIQTNSIHVESEGVHVEVSAFHGRIQSRHGIEVVWRSSDRSFGHICCVPESFQQIRLLSLKQCE